MSKLQTLTYLFCILSINIISAQVVSTDINVIIDSAPNKVEYDLDMNEDGVSDFTLQFQNGIAYIACVGSHNNNEVVCPSHHNVKVYNEGNQAGSSTSGWYNSTNDINSSGFFDDSRLAFKFYPDGNFHGNFVNLSNKFIGTRFFLNGNIHYGYIEISCVVDPAPGYLEIVKIAYEYTPGNPITMGAEGCLTKTFYLDSDGDEFGDDDFEIEACDPPEGYVLDNTDCDDTNDMINPDTDEICNNIDDNCNFLIDEGAELTWHLDTDNDGFGNPDIIFLSCDQPNGYVLDNTDCDDTNFFANPNQIEKCNGFDDNCDGIIDENFPLSIWYIDMDEDGFGDLNDSIELCGPPEGYVDNADDCDDTNDQIYPGSMETCNNIDDNCNGLIDEDVIGTWYMDEDGDGFGNIDSIMMACDQPTGYVEFGTDCIDTNAEINPNAMELCNGFDDNCDGQIDEGYTPTIWYLDMDGDNYGDDDNTLVACDQPIGYIIDYGDCDDNNDSINPGIEDICNGIDDNCDGEIDENTPYETWYEDADNDGFGNNEVHIQNCMQPDGFVMDNTDCNDDDENVNSSVQESCNGIDDNCNGEIDEDIENQIFYFDGDGDGFGTVNITKDTCSQPIGFVINSGDCDDSNALINPGAVEICNAEDDNCNGIIDESSLEIEIYSLMTSSLDSLDGLAWVIVDGGVAPYTFSWSNMSTDSIINNLNVGEYSVTVTDSANCFLEQTVYVNSEGCDSFELEYTVSQVLCFDDCNGSIFLESVIGGTAPYTYLWDDNSVQANRIDLCAGVYLLSVTDVLDCKNEFLIEVMEPSLLALENLNIDSTYSFNGGTPPIVNTVYWVENGYFFLEIEDSNGCFARDSLLKTSVNEINILEEIEISPNVTNSFIFIDYPEGLINEKLSISLFDVNGIRKRIFTEQKSIFVGDISDGMYFLRFDTQKTSHSIPVIIVQ